MGDAPVYALAIENALRNGYRVDPVAGRIYGLKGQPLTVKLCGQQRYPTVSLVVVGMPCRYYVVPAHKVVAFFLWGWQTFAKGVQVRHGDAGVLDIREVNLSLGTGSENQYDKSSAVRKAAAQAARTSQGARGPALRLQDEAIIEMLKEISYGPTGRIKRGLVAEWAERYGFSSSCISEAIKSYKTRALTSGST